MKKKTVAVLFGGMSSEYGVSLQSGHAVICAIDTEKYDVIPVGITREGDWYRYSGPLELIPEDKWHQDPALLTPVTVCVSRSQRGLVELIGQGVRRVEVDAVFPVLHGRNGEDGTVQGMLELAGIPVVGCGALSSALCMDKSRAHTLVQAAGIAVPESVEFDARSKAAALVRIPDEIGFPLFVKPVRAGSSFGVTRVEDPAELEAAMDEALRYDTRALAEKAVEGFEVGCAVMGTEELTVGRVDEILLHGGFFDFQEKYNTDTAEILMPARISPETEERITQAARTIYRALDCACFARVDMFLTPEGEIVFNEVNTIPGFTGHSRFPGMMRGIGLDFRQVVSRILETVL